MIKLIQISDNERNRNSFSSFWVADTTSPLCVRFIQFLQSTHKMDVLFYHFSKHPAKLNRWLPLKYVKNKVHCCAHILSHVRDMKTGIVGNFAVGSVNTTNTNGMQTVMVHAGKYTNLGWVCSLQTQSLCMRRNSSAWATKTLGIPEGSHAIQATARGGLRLYNSQYNRSPSAPVFAWCVGYLTMLYHTAE